MDKALILRKKNENTLGILGMKERTMIMHGEYSIESTPGKGTTVNVKVPFCPTKKHSK